MEVSFTENQIEAFMASGRPSEKFHLAWERVGDSFFDEAVQTVLSKFHPGAFDYPTDNDKAFPIEAWQRVDSVCLCAAESNWMELLDVMKALPVWTAELLSAVARYYADEAQGRFGRALIPEGLETAARPGRKRYAAVFA
jgi:hypothetical protein